MKFDLDVLKSEYENKRSPYRDLGKYLFSIATLGLGALWLWGSTRVISEGHIGVREDMNGNIQLLPPGRHSNFPWESYPAPVQSLSESIIQLGPYTLVTIETGYIGKSLNKGLLTILEAGQHLLMNASHIFEKCIPIKQETKQLEEIKAFTKDNVGLKIFADVRYQITDPELAISKVDDIEQSIKEIAEMQLSQVISHHNRKELIPAANRLNVSPKNGEASENSKEQQGLSLVVKELFDDVKDKLQELGIKLINIGIKSWSIIDSDLAHELAQGAVLESKINAQISTAENAAKITGIKAQAEAEAIKTRAAATAEAAELIGKTPFAKEVERLNKQAELVASAKPGTHLHYGATGPAGFFTQSNSNPLKVSTEEVKVENDGVAHSSMH